MACDLCADEKNPGVPDGGMCKRCNRNVCTRATRSPDRFYHGDLCTCGCGELYCEEDLRDHSSRRHGRVPAECFPALALDISTDALLSAVDMAPQQDGVTAIVELTAGSEEARAVERFLRTMTLLPSVMARQDPIRVAEKIGIEAPLYRRVGDRIRFSHGFVRRPVTLSGVKTLARQAMGVSALRLESSASLFGPFVAGRAQVPLDIAQLASWARTGEAAPGADLSGLPPRLRLAFEAPNRGMERWEAVEVLGADALKVEGVF